MLAGKAIFSQLTDWIHPEQFRRCVQRYDGDHRVHNFSCWDQFLAMTFATYFGGNSNPAPDESGHS